jgi:GT2 family glycosyltransferase
MISIVTAYYNRKKLFYRTLQSIATSVYPNFEVIAVDDASKEYGRLEDLTEEFPFLKVIRVETKDKWYMNSCIPYNMGIAKATGDIIILQNPECLHIHDILTYVANNLDDSNYITMSAYSINERTTEKLLPHINHVDLLELSPQQTVTDYVGWYNHSKYNPTYYHFCSAITKANMDKLGGFDERFAPGIGFEDNEFLDRVKRLGLKLILADDVSVFHQWHPKVYDLDVVRKFKDLYDMNGRLRLDKTKRENIIKVKNSYV